MQGRAVIAIIAMILFGLGVILLSFIWHTWLHALDDWIEREIKKP